MIASGPQPGAAESAGGRELLLTDFSAAGPDLGWYVVNDNVMGGRSIGGFELEPEKLHFEGRTNTDGGGFSSIRTRPLALDLSDYSGIRVNVRGDGRRYTWRLTTDARWRGRPVGYWADFETEPGGWRTVDIPFSRFKPQFRGFPLDGPALDSSRITGMGLMIYDKLDGSFSLSLSGVYAYRADKPFNLDALQWEKRVLLLSAPAAEDNALRRQQQAVTATQAEFEDREMILVTLLENGVSTAGNRTLSSAEAEAVRAALGVRPGAFALRLVGKDGSVKLSRDTPVAMDDIYALIDTMPMRKRELRDR